MRVRDRGWRVLLISTFLVVKLNTAWTTIDGLACHEIFANVIEPLKFELLSQNRFLHKISMWREDFYLLLNDGFVMLG